MADTETCVRERYVYFPGCRLLGAGQSPPEDSGIIINERVPVVKDDRPKAFREKAKDDFTGWTVWASSIVASRWAAAHAAEFSGRDVLELGSGCGLAGLLVATVCRPASVHLSDYNAGTVSNLAENVAANCTAGGGGEAGEAPGGGGGGGFTSRGGADVRVHQMDWDEPDTWPQAGGGPRAFDVVLGADLLYRRSYARKLAVVLDGVLRPGGAFVCATPAQREGLPLLLRLLSERGYEVRKEECPPEWRTNPLVAGSLLAGAERCGEGAGGGQSAGAGGEQEPAGGGASSGGGAGGAAAASDGLFPELYMRSYPLLVIHCSKPLEQLRQEDGEVE